MMVEKCLDAACSLCQTGSLGESRPAKTYADGLEAAAQSCDDAATYYAGRDDSEAISMCTVLEMQAKIIRKLKETN